MAATYLSLVPSQGQQVAGKEQRVGNGGPYSTSGNAAYDEVAVIDVKGLTKVNIIITELLNQAGNYRIRGINEDVSRLTLAGVIAAHRCAIISGPTALSVQAGVNININEPHTWLLIEISKTSAGAGTNHVRVDVVGESN
jgi:hypothetical protein